MEQLSELQKRLRELDRKLKQEIAPLQPLHHSSGDWDFANANWILDGTVYVSAPSSLKFTANNNTLIKVATVPIANVKEGRIITYLRADADGRGGEIVFRYQDSDNYYAAVLTFNSSGATQYIRKYKAGVSSDLQTISSIYATGVWRKFRITWWNDYVGLVIRVERWNTGTLAWETAIADAYDASNDWKTIGGRIGFGGFHTAWSDGLYVDDSEIYGIG